jgi:hypothetical protein
MGFVCYFYCNFEFCERAILVGKNIYHWRNREMESGFWLVLELVLTLILSCYFRVCLPCLFKYSMTAKLYSYGWTLVYRNTALSKAAGLSLPRKHEVAFHAEYVSDMTLAESVELLTGYLNVLKPTGYVMHQEVPTLYVFCFYLRTNSEFCPIQHQFLGFYNRNEMCSLRGANWVFK